MGETPPGGSFVWRTWTYRDELGDAVADMEVTARNLASMGLATNCAASLYDSGSVAWNGFLTQRRFDIRGNVAAIWNPEGRGTFFVRDGVGRVVRTYGAAYPSARLLDTAGCLVGLGTTRTGTAWDSTFWDYDPATGLCTNKTYADGTAVAHTFAPDGLPLRTTLASGRWTQNAYDANRRLSSVTTSDGEGSVSYLYDAFGRATRATGSAVRYDYARDAIGRTTSEVRRTGGFHPSIVSTLSRSFDSCGRPAGLGLIFYGDFKQGVCYTWGMEGKLQGMVCSNAQGRAVEVSFDWEGGRGVGWSAEGLGNCPAYFRQGFGRAARRPALVTSCQAGRGGFHNPSRSFSYAYDAVGRPVERDADAFVYNARGEVTNAIVGTGTWRYAYDHIGNRQSAYEDGVSTSYSANEVNQYTEVGNDEPEYDDDGNLVDDGTRTFEWSAAGHLTEAATPSRRYECVYDHLGRRVKRTEYRRSGNNWYWVEDRDYVYDGWNLVFEYRDHTSEGEAELAYYWGPDLSGTLQGAGGVGGLVAVSVDGSFYFPGYDNNGNVVGYWDESGSLVAEYAYDAFGNTISSSGTLASVFPHRFSTKYLDAETDLYYYGYRYYLPELGRWISRDPVKETGGINLFAAFSNNPVVFFDAKGLTPKGTDLWEHYSPYSYASADTAQIWKTIGGKAAEAAGYREDDEGNPIAVPNGCAARLSLSLNEISGEEISSPFDFRNYPGEAGRTGKYIVGAKRMKDYLSGKWGTKAVLSETDAYYFKSKAKAFETDALRGEIADILCNSSCWPNYVAVVVSVQHGPVSGHVAVVTPEYNDDHTPYTDDTVVWILPSTL